MPSTVREVKQLLHTKFGFSPLIDGNRDHDWLEKQFNGLPTIRRKFSRHKEDIGAKLEGRISKQLRVRKPFYNGMMGCTKSPADYESQLRTDPYPPFNQLLV